MSGEAPIEAILARLKRVKQVRADQWEAACPGHEDRKPSLSVSVGQDGRVLLKCQANCPVEKVCEAMGIGLRDLFPARAQSPTIVATYDYSDEAGNFLFQVVRYSPKGFKQRRRNQNGGWVWDLKGVRRVLYHLPELAAARPDQPVWICEGEKDVDRLRALGLLATTSPQGAGKWKKVDSACFEHLRGRVVYIIPDNDSAGRSHARDVAASLKEIAADVRIVELPGVPTRGDVSDWLDTGGSGEHLRALADSAPTAEAWMADPAWSAQDDDACDNESADNRPRSAATILIGIGRECRLFHTATDEAFAVVNHDAHKEVHAVRGGRFRRWLIGRYFDSTGTAPNAQAVQDALGVIEAEALFRSPEERVFVRVGEREGRVYLDLCDERWRVVEVSKDGWRVLDASPVNFVRRPGMLPLPLPERGGSLNELRDLLNLPVREEDGGGDQFVLLVSWTLGALHPCGPYPVLVLSGEQGSAKSTTARMVRMLVDPNKAPLRSAPREERDLAIAASNSWIVGLDNISNLRDWLSDAFCRVATGGGFSTRTLYENTEETILDFKRPIILNGIGEVVTASDILDRALRVHLPAIPDERRKTEREVWARFCAMQARLLGALLDAVAVGLSRVDSNRLGAGPRMLDFAEWVNAAEPALPWSAGAFLRAYAGNRDSAHKTALEASPVGEAMGLLMEGRDRWSGTATGLLDELNDIMGGADKMRSRQGWPRASNALSNAIARLAPNLRAAGIDVDCRRARTDRRKVWTFTNRKTAPVIVPIVPIVQKAQETSKNGVLASVHANDPSNDEPRRTVLAARPPHGTGNDPNAANDAVPPASVEGRAPPALDDEDNGWGDYEDSSE